MDDGLKYLNELTWAYRASRTLLIANGLKIFTLLDGGALSCQELAKKCIAKADLLDRILTACCAMGLLKRDGTGYVNSDLSQKFLVKGKPLYQGDIIAHSAMVWGVWDRLADEIMETPGAQEDQSQTHQNFIMGMHNITMGGRGKLFLESIDLSGRKHLLDIGGGPGTYSILACRKYPDLKATVFDLPETIEIAKKVIKDEGMESRIFVRPGSWDADDFGDGFDAALMSNILHGADSQAKMILQKAYDSLESGAMLIVQEFLMNDSKTGPVVPALFNVMVGAYSQAELFAVIEEAGFGQVQIVTSCQEIGSSWITAIKP